METLIQISTMGLKMDTQTECSNLDTLNWNFWLDTDGWLQKNTSALPERKNKEKFQIIDIENKILAGLQVVTISFLTEADLRYDEIEWEESPNSIFIYVLQCIESNPN